MTRSPEPLPCPVCSASRWHPIEHFRFVRKEHADSLLENRLALEIQRWVELVIRNGPSPKTVQGCVTAAPKASLKETILFDEWNSANETLELSTVFCEVCGFCCFSPRPSTQQLDRKYQLFSEHRTSSPAKPTAENTLARRTRQQLLRKRLQPHLESNYRSYLDFGGGDGFLISQFAQGDNRCFVIDYQPTPSAGVTKIGDTIDEIPAGANYDVIVCSHVLEHLVDPGLTLRLLNKALAANGVIYVEVPLEIFGAVRIEKDPVTHINFFTPASLRSLVEQSGFVVLESAVDTAPYSNHLIEVIWVIAKTRDTTEKNPAARPAKPDVMSYLRPGRLRLLQRLLRGLTRALRQRLRI